MRTVSVLIGIAACLAVARASTPEELVACPVSPNLRGHENIEWSIGYAFHLTDQNKDLPRVLLVGDSICNGYQGEVQKRLEGKMNVSYWASSYCVTSPGYLKLLDFYLSEARYDVIHFNNGCHSFDTSDADWEKGLRAALQLIRLRQPQAKLIWGMTTPNRNEARNLRVKALNALAARVIDEFDGIAVDDLYAQMDSLDRKTQWRDDFHFVQSAISVQADVVSKICLECSWDSAGTDPAKRLKTQGLTRFEGFVAERAAGRSKEGGDGGIMVQWGGWNEALEGDL